MLRQCASPFREKKCVYYKKESLWVLSGGIRIVSVACYQNSSRLGGNSALNHLRLRLRKHKSEQSHEAHFSEHPILLVKDTWKETLKRTAVKTEQPRGENNFTTKINPP